MPIKGMTDNVQPRFPRLGKLRKGMLKEKVRNDGKTVYYPVDLDHFRFTSEQPEVEQAFQSAFGESPRSLRVFLPYRTVDQNFPTWREEWAAGGLVHRCDGEVMTIWRTPDGHYSSEPRPCPYHSGEKQRNMQARPPVPGCLPVGRLSLIIPELLDAGWVGYVTLETHSINDLIRITAALKEAEENALSGGRAMGLQGIEFRLWRQEEKISTPDSGRRVRRAKWMVLLAPAVHWVSVQYQIAQQAALGQLPAPADDVADGEGFESPREVEDYAVDGEWYDMAVQDFVGAPEAEGNGAAQEPAAEAADEMPPEPEAPPEESEAPADNGRNGNGSGHNGQDDDPWAHIPARDDGFRIPAWFTPDDETLARFRAVKMGNGKHRGKTLGQIDDADPGYIRWLTTTEPRGEFQRNLQRAATYIRAHRMWQEQRYQLPMEF